MFNTELMVTAKDLYGKNALVTFKVIVHKEKFYSDENQNIRLKPVVNTKQAEANKQNEPVIVQTRRLAFSEQ